MACFISEINNYPGVNYREKEILFKMGTIQTYLMARIRCEESIKY